MNNIINITACDNEVYLIAYQGNGSYELAHLNSGYNYSVDVTITVESGNYSPVSIINGQSGPIKESYTVYLPKGTYTIAAVCVNWGGPWAYAYTLNGGSPYSGSDTSGAGAIATGPGLTVVFGSVPPVISQMNARSAPTPPNGMKVDCCVGPNSPAPDGSSTTCPVVIYNGITFWPFSYIDNRLSLGLVGYKPGRIVSQQELKGTRYVWKAVVNTTTQTVTFSGQNNDTVSIPWAKLK